MNAVVIAIALVYLAMTVFLGAYVATQKNREPAEGAILGLFFSVFGVLIEACLPTNTPD